MHIEEYISFKYKGAEPKSRFQYVTEHPKEYYDGRNPDWLMPSELEKELWLFYFNGFLVQPKPSLWTPFMDFHLHECYDKRDFLEFVKESPDRMPYTLVSDVYMCDSYQSKLQERARSWVEKKQPLLERLPDIQLGKPDRRIKARRKDELEYVSIWETERFFMERWARPRNAGAMVNILGEQDIRDFVHANFHGSENPVDRRRLKSNGFQKDILLAVSEYYMTIDTGNASTVDYCHMLVDVFEEFSNYINTETGEYRLKELSKNFMRYTDEIMRGQLKS